MSDITSFRVQDWSTFWWRPQRAGVSEHNCSLNVNKNNIKMKDITFQVSHLISSVLLYNNRSVVSCVSPCCLSCSFVFFHFHPELLSLSVSGLSYRPALCTLLTGTMCFHASPSMNRHRTGGGAGVGGREKQNGALIAAVGFIWTEEENSGVVLWSVVPPDVQRYANLRLMMEIFLLFRVSTQHTVVTWEWVTEGLCVGWRYSMGCPSCRNQLVDGERTGLLEGASSFTRSRLCEVPHPESSCSSAFSESFNF